MAKTIQQKAEEVAAKHGITAEAVSTQKAGKGTIIKVALPNGKNIATDNVDGWEGELSKQIAKFKNKK